MIKILNSKLNLIYIITIQLNILKLFRSFKKFFFKLFQVFFTKERQTTIRIEEEFDKVRQTAFINFK